MSTTFDGKLELKLDSTTVEGKVALSTITEVDTALTGFVRGVTVDGESIVDDDKIANLGKLAGNDVITENDLSGDFVWDCVGAE